MPQPFVKFVEPRAWDLGPQAELVKVSGRGLVGADLTRLVKRAGHLFADAVRRTPWPKGEELVHLIAMGATEYHGANRNGDGFKCASCRKHAHTFVTVPATRGGAWFYRDHANKDTHRSYGTVKLAAFNEEMKRVELVVGLNATKEAADRYRALVADREMDKLARGDDIAVSMACTIPFDVCSGCGNRARSRAEYCTGVSEGGHCKYGGLKHRITKVAEDGHVLHADNPDPTFFDISHVGRPADRTAFVLGRVKEAAAHGRPPCGAELAEAYGSPYGEAVFALGLEKRARATALAAFRAAVAGEALDADPARRRDAVNRAFDHRSGGPKAAAGRPDLPPAVLCRALADADVLLPPAQFADLFGGKAADLGGPGAFQALVAAADPGAELAASPHAPALASPPAAARAWAAGLKQAYGVGPAEVKARVVAHALRHADGPAWTPAPAVPPGHKAAAAYGAYLAAALAHPGFGGPRAEEMAARMVRVA